jgi:hypothetical protein
VTVYTSVLYFDRSILVESKDLESATPEASSPLPDEQSTKETNFLIYFQGGDWWHVEFYGPDDPKDT